MRKVPFVTSAVAGFAAAVAGMAFTAPANATVVPNGLFSYSIPAGSTVNTGDIASTTTSLTLGNTFPGAQITSFLDPYLGSPNNFCGAANGGCAAAHSPGFLFPTSGILFSDLTMPVGNPSPVSFAETVTAQTNFGAPAGVVSVDFDFTSISTGALTPTTSTSVGALTLDFQGTFASDNTHQYTLGQAANMSITCMQPTLSGAITCNGRIDTPPAVPEPWSLALLGSAIVGFGAFRRRKSC